MQFSRCLTAASVGFMVCLCGCNHYAYPPYGAPYGGYGPTPYPAAPGGTYPAPSSTFMGPSSTYAPYGSPAGPSPTPISPNGMSAPSQPDWRQPNGNPAPSYDGPAGGNRENPVPNPTNDEQGFGTPPAAKANSNPGAAASNFSNSGVQLQPIDAGPAFPPGAAAPSNIIVENDDPFESPLRPTSSGTNVTARSASLGSTESRPNPFAHDARNFTWLRGIVDYDSQDQRWVIIYSADPDSNDRYGGSITLSDHALLQRVKPGDVVLVEGAVDAASFDHHGKPIYKITKLQPLKPKT